MHGVTTWLGNSPKIASDHYLSVRDEDFTQAVSLGVRQQLHEIPENKPQPLPKIEKISGIT